MRHNNSIKLDKHILKDFPKIELHRHLEGSLSLDNLCEIALRNNSEEFKNFETFKKKYQFPQNSKPDFLAFISKFQINLFKSLDDISSITYQSIKKLKEDGLFYIELRLAPHYFARQHNFDPIEITKLIIKNGNKAAKEIDLHLRYLITFSRRTQTSDEILKIYDQITSLNFKEIIGIDLAGDEFNFPPKLFIPAFDEIYKRNQHKITIHAGEVTSSDQVWTVIKDLHAFRIGHGTSVIHDKKLQKYLRKKNIALEQCITSNSLTGSWRNGEKNHPLGRLYRKGVPVTINSDDPTIQDSDLTDEYIKVIRYFGFTIEDLININLTALRCSFLPNNEKQMLEKEYLRRIKYFRDKHVD
ncbi:MAG: adenosine deaminase [Candidatus Thorarchaeota archaeon]